MVKVSGPRINALRIPFLFHMCPNPSPGQIQTTYTCITVFLQEKVDALRVLGADVRPVPAVPFDNPDNYNHQVMIVAALTNSFFPRLSSSFYMTFKHPILSYMYLRGQRSHNFSQSRAYAQTSHEDMVILCKYSVPLFQCLKATCTVHVGGYVVIL